MCEILFVGVTDMAIMRNVALISHKFNVVYKGCT